MTTKQKKISRYAVNLHSFSTNNIISMRITPMRIICMYDSVVTFISVDITRWRIFKNDLNIRVSYN